MKRSFLPPPVPDPSAPEMRLSHRPRFREGAVALRDVAACQLREREVVFLREELRLLEAQSALVGEALATAPAEAESDSETLRGYLRACIESSIGAALKWLELLETSDAGAQASHVYAIKLRNRDRARVLATWKAAAAGASRPADPPTSPSPEVADDSAHFEELGWDLPATRLELSEREDDDVFTPGEGDVVELADSAAPPAEVESHSHRVASLIELRAHELGYVEREVQLFAAQAELSVDGGVDAGMVSRASHSDHLTPEALKLIEELSTYLEADAPSFREIGRGHHAACLGIAIATSKDWLAFLAAPDEPTRLRRLFAVQSQNRERARRTLAWQTAVHAAQRRRHLTQQLRSAMAQRLPEEQHLTGEEVEIIDDDALALEAAKRQPLPLPTVPPAPEFEVPPEFQHVPPSSQLLAAPAADPVAAPVETSSTARASSRPPLDRRLVRPRLPFAEPIVLGGEHAFYTGFAGDISGSGIFVATFNTPAKVGDVFLVEFELPDGVRISVDAEVRWHREFARDQPEVMPGVGLRFLDVGPEMEARIKAYIAAEGALFYEE